MTVIKTNLTSKQIRDTEILSAIPQYLLEGETEVEMAHRFKGDLVKTIQFLRERAFTNLAPEKEISEDSILHPKHEPKYSEPEKGKKGKVKIKLNKSAQGGLF